MSAPDLISFLSQALYVIVFAAVAVEAARRPRRTTFDTALLFGATSLVIAEGLVVKLTGFQAPPMLTVIDGVLILALPYLLLRLLDDFVGTARWLLRTAEALLALTAIALFIKPTGAPLWLSLAEVLYFVVLTLYDTTAFITAAAQSNGIGRRRLLAVACGSAFLAATILLAGVSAADPAASAWVTLVSQVLALGSGIGYLLGFAPPRWLRQAWQAPEVQGFFGRAVSFAHLPDDRALVGELEQGVATTLARGEVYIGLWNEPDGVLEFMQHPHLATMEREAELASLGVSHADGVLRSAPDMMLAGRAFSDQRPIFSGDPCKDDPEYAGLYRRRDIGTVMAAPITAMDRPLGVAVVYARRAPLFAEDDMAVLRQLADYCAVVLESWTLVQESARTRAKQELEQLKDEFLAAAAHDLKTPLTSIKGLSQMIQRRLGRPQLEISSIESDLRLIDDSAVRMTSLVDELLDISRMQMDRGFDLNRRPTDLVGVAGGCVQMRARTTPRHTIELDAAEAELIGNWDRERFERILDNLLDNAIKYSPQGGAVSVALRRERRGEAEWALVSVSDEGMGIPKGDLQRIFERFQRGSNTTHAKIAGTGIGLAYVRQVVEQHGGAVVVDSVEGQGSTFTVELPLELPSGALGKVASQGAAAV